MRQAVGHGERLRAKRLGPGSRRAVDYTGNAAHRYARSEMIRMTFLLAAAALPVERSFVGRAAGITRPKSYLHPHRIDLQRRCRIAARLMLSSPACLTESAKVTCLMSHTATYFEQAGEIARQIDVDAIENLATALAAVRERGGRLFILGVGGSAANCSHAVNDFRKLCGIEAYAPTDNVSELTARTNDEGWETVFAAWLRTSRANSKDAVLVFSVGGGDAERKISANIVHGLDEAKARGLMICGVVGRNGGYTKKVGDHVVVIPTIDPAHITPHTEAFQAVVWHCLVSHPKLQVQGTKWEGAVR
jgi:D-sedoheptulose 7-phosphate isomerase